MATTLLNIFLLNVNFEFLTNSTLDYIFFYILHAYKIFRKSRMNSYVIYEFLDFKFFVM